MKTEELMDIVNTVCNKVDGDISTDKITGLVDGYIEYRDYDITGDELDSVYEEIVDTINDWGYKVV